MAKIAFIGLGNMGCPMAINLSQAGHEVTVFDLLETSMDNVVEKGAHKASSAKDAVAGKEIIISMLPAGKHVKSLYMSQDSIVEHVQPNALVIDSSTIDANSAKEVGRELSRKGIRFLDAPVSGGVAGATAGTLTFIVGGQRADVTQAQPILLDMGKNVFHAGDVGAGQIAKICNNMLLAVQMAGTAEALQLGIHNGLDAKILSDIMLQSSGKNWALEVYNPCPNVLENVPSSRDYQGGFMVNLMQKDLGLAMDTAHLSQSATPMGALARSLYDLHSNQGNGQLDFSSIFNLFSTTQGK